MSKSRKAAYIILLLLLTGGIVLCVVRWKAWFANPEEPLWEGDTIAYRFHTFGEETLDGFAKYEGAHSVVWQDLHEPDTLMFLLLGDVHNGIDSAHWAALAQRHPHLDFYAQLGDFIERGYFYYEQQLVSELEGTLFEQLPIVCTPGNHEYRKGVVKRLPDLWYSAFPQPQNGPYRFLGTTFYVDFPDLRLIAIDTNGLQRLSDYTIVNTWVRKALQEAGDRFTVVMMHHPVYSASSGRQNPFVNLTFRRVLQDADIVFAGHDHNYARRLPFIVTVSRTASHTCLPSTLTDTLCIETRLLETGELYDLVKVIHTPDTTLTDQSDPRTFVKTYIEPMNDCPEIIELPEKYQGKNSRKVQRFLLKRASRTL